MLARYYHDLGSPQSKGCDRRRSLSWLRLWLTCDAKVEDDEAEQFVVRSKEISL
jgi:hypothetical protein